MLYRRNITASLNRVTNIFSSIKSSEILIKNAQTRNADRTTSNCKYLPGNIIKIKLSEKVKYFIFLRGKKYSK